MITTMKKQPPKQSSSWTPKFVWLRIVKLQRPDNGKPSWGIVCLDTLETRYSASQGRTIWRAPA